MALPWFRILDTAIDVVKFARSRRAAAEGDPDQQLAAGARPLGAIETRLAGVVVAALKEAFDRDSRRLDLEREQLEAERLRAERALRLELMRQAADREIGRLRLLAGVAIASWLGTLFFSSRLIAGGAVPKVMLGLGWAMLLGAAALAFAAHGQVEDAIRRESPPPDDAGQVAPWLIVGALAIIGAAALVA
jgi:hypothetical protein